jgi:hypothetical protein
MKYRVTELPALKRRNNLLSQNFLLVIGNPLEISGIFFQCKSCTAPKASIILLINFVTLITTAASSRNYVGMMENEFEKDEKYRRISGTGKSSLGEW